MNSAFWHGKRVFLTGHTGFKGSWLSLWLQSLGAKVYGYSLSPPTEPNLYTIAHVQDHIASHTIADIRDIVTLTQTMQAAGPEIVFHLAAQPLVRRSYAEPLETYAVNVIGSANLLETVRVTPGIRAVVMVTTDKCYENHEWLWGYRENDQVGGWDPYSSSKACVEILTNAWRHSYFGDGHVVVATARAGNVIGGGDWACDRLVPDFFRSLESGKSLRIRAPEAVRPWQHVLEPLSGYLALAQALYTEGSFYAEPWNFGPPDREARSVRWIVERLVEAFPGMTWENDQSPQPHEAHYLKLDSTKARTYLGWEPCWDIETTLAKTCEWYASWRQGIDMRAVSIAQIDAYTNTAPLV